MAGHPPFINSTGLISKILSKIAEAQKPDRFTQDYLVNVLGFGSGSARPIIGLLKRIGFLQTDGTPTPLYARFRNETERPSAMLEALKIGYPTIYARSEYAHTMPKDRLRQLVIEVTGLEADNAVVRAIVGTFEALKAVGGVTDKTKAIAGPMPEALKGVLTPEEGKNIAPRTNGEEVGLNLSYTINLNLPSSSDPEVFNAIFKALKEHLLGK